MFNFQFNYTFIFFYILIICLLLSLLFFLSYFITKKNPTYDKLSAYECGYEAFNDVQQHQDIRYFILGLLFIIFDIEVMFLFPLISILSFDGNFFFLMGFDFLIELGLGYLIAWQFSIFDWK